MTYNTDVLIIGAGPAGLTAASLLASYGVKVMVVEKYGWLADTPRAHITNQATMEVLRDLGIEGAALKHASKQNMMANNTFCYSLAGEEFGRLLSWGNHPARQADYDLASPCAMCDLPQTFLEPVLLTAAGERGAKIMFNSEFMRFEQDAEGVTTTLKDRQTGGELQVRSKYMIGADGARSRVAEQLGLPMTGQMGRSGSMNILFDADLSKYVAHRPSVLYWVLQPGAQVGGIGAGVVRMVRPWNEWLAIWGYDISQGEMKLSDEDAIKIVHQLIGDDTIDIKIRSTSTWTVNEMWATELSKGRVFCMGDAVHRHPPLNGLGSNTSIQDAHNLAWKLKLVLDGVAGEALLDSYTAERAPVGEKIVTRANRSMEDYPPIFDALGLIGAASPEAAKVALERRKENTPEAKDRRKRLYEAIRKKNYEYNTHGVELNNRYASTAVMPDGTPEPAYERDPELYYHATTWPGARLPHVWVNLGDRKVSTKDLVGQGRFTVLTGVGGEAWAEAARQAGEEFGLRIDCVTIGPEGCDAYDIFADWYYASEVEEDGCVLVRPDSYVGWRSKEMPDDAAGALRGAMARILSRQ
jgi:2,4-dichlorophenol 6-monooxygenase